jgi:hypothetical protein
VKTIPAVFLGILVSIAAAAQTGQIGDDTGLPYSSAGNGSISMKFIGFRRLITVVEGTIGHAELSIRDERHDGVLSAFSFGIGSEFFAGGALKAQGVLAPIIGRSPGSAVLRSSLSADTGFGIDTGKSVPEFFGAAVTLKPVAVSGRKGTKKSLDAENKLTVFGINGSVFEGCGLATTIGSDGSFSCDAGAVTGRILLPERSKWFSPLNGKPGNESCEAFSLRTKGKLGRATLGLLGACLLPRHSPVGFLAAADFRYSASRYDASAFASYVGASFDPEGRNGNTVSAELKLGLDELFGMKIVGALSGNLHLGETARSIAMADGREQGTAGGSISFARRGTGFSPALDFRWETAFGPSGTTSDEADATFGWNFDPFSGAAALVVGRSVGESALAFKSASFDVAFRAGPVVTAGIDITRGAVSEGGGSRCEAGWSLSVRGTGPVRPGLVLRSSEKTPLGNFGKDPSRLIGSTLCELELTVSGASRARL